MRHLCLALTLLRAVDAEKYVVWSEQALATSTKPTARALASAGVAYDAGEVVVAGEFVWLFGGMDASQEGITANTMFADVWLYTVTTRMWEEKTALANANSGATPAARRGAPMVVHLNQNAFVHGGESSGGVINADLWKLTLSRTAPRWEVIIGAITSKSVSYTGVASSGASPSARTRHTATLIKLPWLSGKPQGIVVFGGKASNLQALSDVHAFAWTDTTNYNQGRWYQLTPDGAAPAARMGHAAIEMLDTLIVMGGADPVASPPVKYADVHVLSLTTSTWITPVVVGSRAPPGRDGHSVLKVGSTVYVFGGLSSAGERLNDLWSFNAYATVAGQLEWDQPTAMSQVPATRWGHAGLSSAFAGVVLGGISGTNSGLDDVWRLSSGCSGQLTLTAASGAFSDGDGDYVANLDCKWIITPSVSNANVRISFSMIDITDLNDKVLLYDGTSTTDASLNGDGFNGVLLPPSVTSSTGSLLVRFTSDGSRSSAGFAAVYESVCKTGYTWNEYLSSCEPCALGSYAPSPDSVRCFPCPYGSYADATGAVACNACPTSATTPVLGATSIGQCSCQPGYYATATGTALSCAVCKEGGDCSAGGTTIRARAGWCESPGAVSAATIIFKHCCDVTKCPGGQSALCDASVGVIGGADSCRVAYLSWDTIDKLSFTAGTWASFAALLVLLLLLATFAGIGMGYRSGINKKMRPVRPDSSLYSDARKEDDDEYEGDVEAPPPDDGSEQLMGDENGADDALLEHSQLRADDAPQALVPLTDADTSGAPAAAAGASAGLSEVTPSGMQLELAESTSGEGAEGALQQRGSIDEAGEDSDEDDDKKTKKKKKKKKKSKDKGDDGDEGDGEKEKPKRKSRRSKARGDDDDDANAGAPDA